MFINEKALDSDSDFVHFLKIQLFFISKLINEKDLKKGLKKRPRTLIALSSDLATSPPPPLPSATKGNCLPAVIQGEKRVIVRKGRWTISAGNFKQSMRSRNRVEIGLSYRPARARIFKCLWSRRIDSKV
jgi:hypothetical protein